MSLWIKLGWCYNSKIRCLCCPSFRAEEEECGFFFINDVAPLQLLNIFEDDDSAYLLSTLFKSRSFRASLKLSSPSPLRFSLLVFSTEALLSLSDLCVFQLYKNTFFSFLLLVL
ncbi:hypothetical protein LXL04_009668 [Taraxacum kok-saghyz]